MFIFILLFLTFFNQYSVCAEECNWRYGIPGSHNEAARRRTIVGGAKADEDEYGWAVELSMGCGGTLIGREWILTAAHCFTEGPDMDFTITFVGRTINRRTATKVQVFIHPQFSNLSNNPNDIALVQIQSLDCNVINDGINAIGVAAIPNGFDINGCTAFVTGTGTMNGDAWDFGQLQEVIMNAYDYEHCNGGGRYPTPPKLTNKEICAYQDSGEDACQGDSGSPLNIDANTNVNKHHYVQIALVSWGGPTCGDPQYPGVFKLIGPHLNWIMSVFPGVHIDTFDSCDTRDYEEGFDWFYYILGGIALSMLFLFLCANIIIIPFLRK